jgi:hypothetical protein
MEFDRPDIDERVQGWLKLFCFILMAIRPAMFIIRFAQGPKELPWPMSLFVLMFNFVWISLGAFIGYGIYKRHPRSVNWAKGYLIVYFLFSILNFLSRKHNPIPVFIFSIFWCSYLETSKQVKRLFAESRGLRFF